MVVAVLLLIVILPVTSFTPGKLISLAFVPTMKMSPLTTAGSWTKLFTMFISGMFMVYPGGRLNTGVPKGRKKPFPQLKKSVSVEPSPAIAVPACNWISNLNG